MSTLHSPPRGLTRLIVRMPIWLYRLRLGWLFGSRFLLLTHQGRRTGVQRRTVLEVISHDRDSDIYYVAAAWGERAQWLRNLEANPEATVTVGRRRFQAGARIITAEDAERVFLEYGEQHRMGMRALGRLLGSTDPHELADALPIVALKPNREETSRTQ